MKTLEEIDLERARYLLNTDNLLEEMLSENQGIAPTESKLFVQLHKLL